VVHGKELEENESEKMRDLATETGANFMNAKPFTPESFEKSIKPALNS